MRIVSIGEVLWDVIGDTEHLGGAPFNLAAHARRLGHEVLFVSAVGNDDLGRRALRRMAELGLEPAMVTTVEGARTGTVTVELRADGQPSFTIHRPAAYDRVHLDSDALAGLSAFAPDWVCYGTLLQTDPSARATVQALVRATPGAARFYDVNLRPGCWSPALVDELAFNATAIKLNEDEAAVLVPGSSHEDFCRSLAARTGAAAVCITRGARGCALLCDGVFAEAPGRRVDVVDAVGAGDAFSAAFLHGFSLGWSAGAIGEFANCVGAVVASRAGAVPDWDPDECAAAVTHPAAERP